MSVQFVSLLNDCSSITTAVVDFGIEISGIGGMITAAFTELLMKNMNVISKKSGFILFSLLLKLGFHSLVRVYFWSEGFPFNRRLAGILDVFGGIPLKSAGFSADLAGLTMKLAGFLVRRTRYSETAIIGMISELA